MKTILFIALLFLSLAGFSQKQDSVVKYDTVDLNRRINSFIKVYNQDSRQIDTLTLQINKIKEHQTFLIGVIQAYQVLKDEQKKKK